MSDEDKSPPTAPPLANVAELEHEFFEHVCRMAGLPATKENIDHLTAFYEKERTEDEALETECEELAAEENSLAAQLKMSKTKRAETLRQLGNPDTRRKLAAEYVDALIAEDAKNGRRAPEGFTRAMQIDNKTHHLEKQKARWDKFAGWTDKRLRARLSEVKKRTADILGLLRPSPSYVDDYVAADGFHYKTAEKITDECVIAEEKQGDRDKLRWCLRVCGEALAKDIEWLRSLRELRVIAGGKGRVSFDIVLRAMRGTLDTSELTEELPGKFAEPVNRFFWEMADPEKKRAEDQRKRERATREKLIDAANQSGKPLPPLPVDEAAKRMEKIETIAWLLQRKWEWREIARELVRLKLEIAPHETGLRDIGRDTKREKVERILYEPMAARLRKWWTADVLPEIRKYSHDAPEPTKAKGKPKEKRVTKKGAKKRE